MSKPISFRKIAPQATPIRKLMNTRDGMELKIGCISVLLCLACERNDQARTTFLAWIAFGSKELST